MDVSALTKLHIQRGCVLHSCKFDKIDHGKMFVIVGEDCNGFYGFFFINSNINDYIKKRKLLFEMQMPLKHSSYPQFLKYDSFLDCHELHRFPKQKLEEQFGNGDARIIGQITEEDMNLILEATRESVLFSKKEKESFFK